MEWIVKFSIILLKQTIWEFENSKTQVICFGVLYDANFKQILLEKESMRNDQEKILEFLIDQMLEIES